MKNMQNDIIRKQLLESLDGRNAHLTFRDTIKDFPPEYYNEKVGDVEYSCWDLLEHMRIAQYDIIDFIKNPNYQEREWPADYWPKEPADVQKWESSVEKFLDDESEVRGLLEDDSVDLYSPIPHAPKYTIFREVLLILNHNSYHTGQLLVLRKSLGIWPPK
jgi:uncharacterized damage-inducible protein DinB